MSRARVAGAVGGAVVAGLGITALLMAGERKSGVPSELAALERAGAVRLGFIPTPPNRLPSPGEQAVIQGGHLVLSAAAGAAFAASVDPDAPVLRSGIGFGLAFYALAHWVAGPLLGLKAPEWRSGAKPIAMHTVNHVAFGVLTALGARLGSRAGR